MEKKTTKSASKKHLDILRHRAYEGFLSPEQIQIIKDHVTEQEFKAMENEELDVHDLISKYPDISLEFRRHAGQPDIPKLGLFIVPRSLALNSEYWLESIQKRNLRQLDDFGIPHGDNPLMATVWICGLNPKHDNLTDHMIYSDLKDVFREERAPGSVPVAWLEQFVEGQCELFTAASGKQYQIEFSGLKHKYCDRGRFEDVLRDLKNARRERMEEKAQAVNS